MATKRQGLEKRYATLIERSTPPLVSQSPTPDPPPTPLPSWHAETLAYKRARELRANSIEAYRQLAAAEALVAERIAALQEVLDQFEAAKLLYDLAFKRIQADYPEVKNKAWI